MKKILMLCLLIVLTISCELAEAEKAYNEGKYVESVRITTQYLDKQKKFPKGKEKEKILHIFQDIILTYEKNISSLNEDQYDKKILQLKELLEIRNLVNNKKYNDEMQFFTQKYTLLNLKNAIAEQYYYKGNAINGKSLGLLEEKYKVYEIGLQYANYKDMKTLYQQSRQAFFLQQAEENYQLGLLSEKSGAFSEAYTHFTDASKSYKEYGLYKDATKKAKDNEIKYKATIAETYYKKAYEDEQKENFCSAQKNYLKSFEAYKTLGTYKNSQELYEKSKEQCQIQKAFAYYQQGEEILNNAEKKKDYRRAAECFNKSYKEYNKNIKIGNKTYNAYNAYKNAIENGNIHIYISSDDRFLENNIMTVLSKDYITFVKRIEDADEIITIQRQDAYSENYRNVLYVTPYVERIQQGSKQGIDDKGNSIQVPIYKEYHFKKVEYQDTNVFVLTTRINAKGLYAVSWSFDTKTSSQKNYTYYEGNVPINYHNSTRGYLDSAENLKKEAINKSYNELYKYLDSIVNQIEKL